MKNKTGQTDNTSATQQLSQTAQTAQTAPKSRGIIGTFKKSTYDIQLPFSESALLKDLDAYGAHADELLI